MKACFALFAFGLLICGTLAVFGAPEKPVPTRPFEVFVYPQKLTSKDKLTGTGEEITITEETTLIWVDLQPGARFTHSTEFVLISSKGTRVVKSGWWPNLNGKDLFRDGKHYSVDFPLHLVDNPPKDSKEFLKEAKVFIHPQKLTTKDMLVDSDKKIEIKSDTFLAWVDLQPRARFGHPTEYVLISATGTRTVKGEWWPTLNGQALFRGADVSFPLLSQPQPE